MGPKSITVKEYIENLPKDIEPLVMSHPYFAFFILAAGIEFLGKCINDKEDWFTKRNSKKDFKKAIYGLTAFEKYRDFLDENNYDLYHNLRCGLLHATIPDAKIILMQGNSEPTIKEGQLLLSIGHLYDSFSQACIEILDKTWTAKKKDEKFLYFHNDPDNGLYESTGHTNTIKIEIKK